MVKVNNVEQENMQRSFYAGSYSIWLIKSLIKKCIPESLTMYVKNYQKRRDVKRGIHKLLQYTKVEDMIRSRSIVNVAFFVVEASMWKYDELFKLFDKSSSFNPKIILCPYLNYHGSQMKRIMDEAEIYFSSKCYSYIKTWDEDSGRFLDIKKIFQPDIIFYCFPYLQSTKERLYSLYQFPESLVCYVPYSSMVCATEVQFNKTVQNFSWGFFVENTWVKQLVERYSLTKGVNTVVTGCPTLDVYRKKDYNPSNVWKHAQDLKIIWAPHYTIVGGFGIAFATFLQYCDGMIEIAKKYSECVQFAFKPHPFLYPTLCSYWGKEKTDAYYDCWKNMDNTQYVTGDYIDLFWTSSAMIFDSVSFIVEYLYTRNPSLFTYKEGVEKQLNEYGIQAFSCHSKARSLKDVDNFIHGLLQHKCDEMADKKNKFYESFLRLPDGCTASDNIYNYIAKKLNKL